VIMLFAVFHVDRSRNVVITARDLFSTVSKTWMLLRLFSRKQYLHDSFGQDLP